MRCDLCHAVMNVGDVAYVYFTPSTGTLEQARAEPGKYFWAEDPEWGACPTCHERLSYLAAGMVTRELWLIAQTERSLSNQNAMLVPGDLVQTAYLRQSQVEFVMDVLASFLDNKTPGFREEILSEP